MRKSIVLMASLLSSSAFALDFPEPAYQVEKELVAQYIHDKALTESPVLFEVPNPLPDWPCNVPEVEKYKIAGLQAMHPELKGEIDKTMRKAFRNAGMSAEMLPKTSYSNIQIIPLKAQCTKGKLDGELELLVLYDKRDEMNSSIPSGESVVHGTTVISTRAMTRSHRTINAGKADIAGSAFMLMTVQNETHYDDATMESMTIKNNEQLGLNKPMITRTIMYTGQDGTVAIFVAMDEKQVSGGLFGVKVKTIPSLMTIFTRTVDEHHKQMESYKNKQLIASSGMKDNKQHGEQIIYVDNYLKKLNLRIDQQPNMDNAREVTINGVDLIETHNCWQNGVQVKMSPCPGE